ncbi:MAG TPA: hypothetical protein VJ725_15665 [Thermoanaerobaculia bacterium]|nr:hypothetical protein [Thermoanaerobaculia bacterium]
MKISTPAQVRGLRKQMLSLMFRLDTEGSDGVIHPDFLDSNPPAHRPLAARVVLEHGLVSCDPARRTPQGFARETDFLFETNAKEITITATQFSGASESLVLTPRGSELIEVGISNLSVPSLVPNQVHTHDRAFSALLKTPLANFFGGDAGCQPTLGFLPTATAST